jgi:hypothetical protein
MMRRSIDQLDSGNLTREHLEHVPLRVGLLLDSLTQPAWVARSIGLAMETGVVDLALVVLRDVPAAPRAPFLTRLRRASKHILYITYTKLDQKLFPVRPDPFEPTDLTQLLKDVPVQRVTPRQTRFSDYFPDGDVEMIRGYKLDVAVRFGFRILRGRALEIARYGVWSYHHGDNLVNRGGPPGFWEVMDGHPVTGSILQILTEDLDDGRVIHRSWASSDRRSVHRNRCHYYWKASAILSRKLRDLHAEGESALCDSWSDGKGWHGYSQPLYKLPHNSDMVGALTRLASRFVRDKVRQFTTSPQPEWYLAYTLRRGGSDVPASAPYRFKELQPPKGRYWADPFPVESNGRYFIFFEEWVDEVQRGHISVVEVNEKGMVGTPVPVVQRPYHLSYPFMFAWRGDYWMVPESVANRTVELYRATEFPYRWELDRVMLSDVAAVDPTIANIGDRWWMFVSFPDSHSPSAEDELHLFHGESPLGPWTEHRRSPVKSDVRSARGAGRLFQSHGHWYRPSQDCSISYGYGVSINRIVQLDENGYREVEDGKLLPLWDPRLNGTHTLNASRGLTVIDARRFRRRWERAEPGRPRV